MKYNFLFLIFLLGIFNLTRAEGFCKLLPGGQVPRDLVFVLDFSGSMQGSRFEYMMKGVNSVLDSLNGSDTVSIVPFSGCSNVYKYLWFNSDNDAIRKHLASLPSPYGNTCVSSGFKNLVQAVEKAVADGSAGATNSDRAQFVLYFTDGEDYYVSEAIASAEQVVSLGYKIYPISDINGNADLFARITSISGTEAYVNVAPEDFNDLFANIIKKNTLYNVGIVTGCTVLAAIIISILAILIYLLISFIVGLSSLEHAPTWPYRKIIHTTAKYVWVDANGRPCDGDGNPTGAKNPKTSHVPKKHPEVQPGLYFRGDASLSSSMRTGRVLFNDSTGVIPPSAPGGNLRRVRLETTTVRIERGIMICASWIWYVFWDRPKHALQTCCSKKKKTTHGHGKRRGYEALSD